VTSFAFSQPAGTSSAKVLTLSKCIDIALENNVTVRQQQFTLEGKQSRVLAAYGSLMPNLGASGSWSRQQNDRAQTYISGIGWLDEASRTVQNSFSAGLGTNITLFNGLANYASLNQAKSDALATESNLERARQTAVLTVQQLYLSVLQLGQQVKVFEDNLKRDQRQLEQIVEKNKIGSVSISNVYQQQVVVAQDDYILIQAQGSYDKAKADLFSYLRLEPTETFELDSSGIPADIDSTEFSAVNAQYADFGKLVAQAMASRQDYQSAVLGLDMAQSGVTIAKASYFPSVGAYFNYGMNSSTLPLSTLKDNISSYWGVSINWSLFDRFQTNANIQNAQVSLKIAQDELDQTDLTVRSDIKKALLDLGTAERQVVASQRQIVSATEDRKIQEEKYNLGAATLLELLVANANYTNALNSKVSAVYTYLRARKNLDYVVGVMPR
jgi:outer membrane protein